MLFDLINRLRNAGARRLAAALTLIFLPFVVTIAIGAEIVSIILNFITDLALEIVKIAKNLFRVARTGTRL